MARRKRRIRSPHPGVKLKQRALPSGRTRWLARYVDPDTGQTKDQTLDPVALPTHEARALWAKKKAAELARVRMDRAAGILPEPEPTLLQTAIDDYLESTAKRLSDLPR